MKSARQCFCVSMCIFVAVVFSGCVEYRTVTFRTNPEKAKVSVVSDERTGSFSIGQTQVTHSFRFNTNSSKGPSEYKVTFKIDGREPQTVTLMRDNEQFDSNSVTMKKTEEQTEFDIRLEPEPVREVERLEPVISEEAGYTIEPRTVRAWVEDIEREGMPASSIVKLGDFMSILGMSISADGNTLAFSLAEKVKDEGGNEKTIANLRSVRTSGGGITQITSGQWVDASPALGSDGFLFFSSNRFRKGAMDIFRISSTQPGAIAVIRQTFEGINYDPSLGGGGIMAFTYKPTYQGRYSGNKQVWTLGGENQYPTQLREGEMSAVSPDGKQIAFIGPDKQLWKIPVTGQNPVQLTSSPIQRDGKKHPSWSPDGKYILYASDEGKDSKDEANYDIWMIREGGTDIRQLTTNGSVDDFPVVSPDQKYIYFVSNRGFKEGIWRIPFPATD